MYRVEGISGIAGAAGVGSITPGRTLEAAGGAAKTAVPEGQSGEDTEEVKQKKRLGVIECQTCASRTYQDSSGDPGVSMKSPTKLNPTQAASAVPSHEREHYSREAAKASNEDREVLSNSIRIFTSVCPECGKTYVSGGLTTTVTRGKQKNETDAIEALSGTGNNDKKSPASVFGLNLNIANTAYGLSYDQKK